MSILVVAICSGSIRPTRLLPKDGSIVHCAGYQDENLSDPSIGAFNNYTNYLQNNTRPMAFMIYYALTESSPDEINSWFKQFNDELNQYPLTEWFGVQFGLSFYDINGNTYDCGIGNGTYDDHIMAMINGFSLLGRPIWLRIGYEFNGQWTNFTPDCYKSAYQRITTLLRNDEFCNKSGSEIIHFNAHPYLY